MMGDRKEPIIQMLASESVHWETFLCNIHKKKRDISKKETWGNVIKGMQKFICKNPHLTYIFRIFRAQNIYRFQGMEYNSVKNKQPLFEQKKN